MAEREILHYPDPKLKMICEWVDRVDDETRELIDDLAETMYKSKTVGVGLAAPQIGVNKRVIVCDSRDEENPTGLIALVNPEIVEWAEDGVVSTEGCLSCPEINVEVPRSERVIVEAQDRDGNEIELEAEGFLAIILQHELDHLEGRLIVDNISPLKRKLYRNRLKRLQREQD